MEEYLKEIGKVSSDLWRVFKVFILNMAPASEAYWNELSDAMDEAARKYYGTEFEKYARSYAVDLVYEIERKSNTFQKQLEVKND